MSQRPPVRPAPRPATGFGSGTPAAGLGRLPYLPGLDGLRAIAVVAVMIYHANHSWLKGGFLGVEVFFVISGYLITLLLIGEHQRTGTVNLGEFWKDNRGPEYGRDGHWRSPAHRIHVPGRVLMKVLCRTPNENSGRLLMSSQRTMDLILHHPMARE